MNLDAKYVRVDFHGTMMNKSKKKRRVKKMESKWKMSTEIFPVKKTTTTTNFQCLSRINTLKNQMTYTLSSTLSSPYHPSTSLH